MTREEAKIYAKTMTYEDALCNLSRARAVPYRKATFIKVNELIKALSQEPCDDAVSRADRLLDLANAIESDDSGYWTNKRILSALRNISSVTQKSGKWIYEEVTRYEEYYDTVRSYVDKKCKCSACGHDYGYQRMKDPFCRYCGARMESEDKE